MEGGYRNFLYDIIERSINKIVLPCYLQGFIKKIIVQSEEVKMKLDRVNCANSALKAVQNGEK